jgi:hypothetical protein
MHSHFLQYLVISYSIYLNLCSVIPSEWNYSVNYLYFLSISSYVRELIMLVSLIAMSLFIILSLEFSLSIFFLFLFPS